MYLPSWRPRKGYLLSHQHSKPSWFHSIVLDCPHTTYIISKSLLLLKERFSSIPGASPGAWADPLADGPCHHAHGPSGHTGGRPPATHAHQPTGRSALFLIAVNSYPRRESSSWVDASCIFWARAVRGSFFWKAEDNGVLLFFIRVDTHS